MGTKVFGRAQMQETSSLPTLTNQMYLCLYAVEPLQRQMRISTLLSFLPSVSEVLLMYVEVLLLPGRKLRCEEQEICPCPHGK